MLSFFEVLLSDITPKLNSKNISFLLVNRIKTIFSFNTAEDFEKAIEDNQILDVNYIGLLVIKKDVTLEMIKKSVKRMNVKGTLIAPKEIKDYLKSIQ